jgi:acyl-coenzyme A thioesterase PaaI-like protein
MSSGEWAHLDRSDPRSPLFADTSESGVILCGACRVLRRCRLGVEHETLNDDGTVHSTLICPSDQEGGPQVAHGGWTAGVLDELSGHALLLRDEFAVTGTLTVRFVRPVPIMWPLSAKATVTGRDGRKVFVACELRLTEGGELMATSEAVMIRRPGDHFDRHQRWLSQLGDRSSGETE